MFAISQKRVVVQYLLLPKLKTTATIFVTDMHLSKILFFCLYFRLLPENKKQKDHHHICAIPEGVAVVPM